MSVQDLTAGGGAQTATVPAATAGFQIAKGAGRLQIVMVQADMATTPLKFYDNAAGDNSGVLIGIIPITAKAGDRFWFHMPTLLGIAAVGGSGQTACTVSFN